MDVYALLYVEKILAVILCISLLFTFYYMYIVYNTIRDILLCDVTAAAAAVAGLWSLAFFSCAS